MKELERTFLARSVPDLSGCESWEIVDIYIPASAEHPTLRIRKFGDRYEMTKKEPVGSDSSVQEEQTIRLTEQEFLVLSSLKGKRFRKIRYYYICAGRRAEVDVFQDALKGLVLVDFEFSSEEEKDAFTMPDFCLTEVTQEEFVAGGMLAGKSYAEVERLLERLGYRRL